MPEPRSMRKYVVDDPERYLKGKPIRTEDKYLTDDELKIAQNMDNRSNSLMQTLVSKQHAIFYLGKGNLQKAEEKFWDALNNDRSGDSDFFYRNNLKSIADTYYKNALVAGLCGKTKQAGELLASAKYIYQNLAEIDTSHELAQIEKRQSEIATGGIRREFERMLFDADKAFRSGDLSGSMKLYEQLLALDQNHFETNMRLAYIYAKEGLKSAHGGDYDNSTRYMQMAEFAINKARGSPQAENNLEFRAIESEVYYSGGFLLQATNDLAGAREKYDKAIEAIPGRWQYHLARADLIVSMQHSTREDYGVAAKDYEYALSESALDEYNKTHPMATKTPINITDNSLLKFGTEILDEFIAPRAGRSEKEYARQKLFEAERTRKLAYCYEESGRPIMAEKTYRKAENIAKSTEESTKTMHDKAAARETLAAAQNEISIIGYSLETLSYSYLRYAGEYAGKALREIDKLGAGGKWIDVQNAWSRLGGDNAQIYYASAIQLDSKNAYAHDGLAGLYLRFAQEFIRTEGSAPPYKKSGDIILQYLEGADKQYSLAYSVFGIGNAGAPEKTDWAETKYLMAAYYMKQEDMAGYDKAFTTLTSAMEMNPNLPEYRNKMKELADAYTGLGYRLVHPGDGPAHYSWAEKEEADEAFNKAIGICASLGLGPNAAAYDGLADNQYKNATVRKDWDADELKKCVPLYEEALRYETDKKARGEMLYKLSLMHDRLGDSKSAKEEKREAIASGGTIGHAMEFLERSKENTKAGLYDNLRLPPKTNLEQAQEDLKKALELDPHNGQILEQMRKLSLEFYNSAMGNFAYHTPAGKKMQYLENAALLDPQNCRAHLELSKIYLQKNDLDNAKTEYEAAYGSLEQGTRTLAQADADALRYDVRQQRWELAKQYVKRGWTLINPREILRANQEPERATDEQYKSALADFTTALKLDPTSANAHYCYALAHGEMRRRAGLPLDDEFARHMTLAVNSDPTLQAGYQKLIEYFISSDDAEKTVEAATAYLRLLENIRNETSRENWQNEREIVKTHVSRGIGEQRLGDYNLAIEDLTIALELMGQKELAFMDEQIAQARRIKADGHKSLKQYAQANEDYSRVIELLGPNSQTLNDKSYADLMHAFYGRGIGNKALGQNEQALDDLSNAIRLSDARGLYGNDFADICTTYLLMRIELGRTDGIVEETERLASKIDRPPLEFAGIYYACSQKMHDAGNSKKELECLDKAIRIEPSSPKSAGYRFARAKILVEMSQEERAMHDLDFVISREWANVDARVMRAGICRRQHRYIEALSDYDAALKIDSKMSAAYIGRAETNYSILFGAYSSGEVTSIPLFSGTYDEVVAEFTKRGVTLKENQKNILRGSEKNSIVAGGEIYLIDGSGSRLIISQEHDPKREAYYSQLEKNPDKTIQQSILDDIASAKEFAKTSANAKDDKGFAATLGHLEQDIARFGPLPNLGRHTPEQLVACEWSGTFESVYQKDKFWQVRSIAGHYAEIDRTIEVLATDSRFRDAYRLQPGNFPRYWGRSMLTYEEYIRQVSFMYANQDRTGVSALLQVSHALAESHFHFRVNGRNGAGLNQFTGSGAETATRNSTRADGVLEQYGFGALGCPMGHYYDHELADWRVGPDSKIYEYSKKDEKSVRIKAVFDPDMTDPIISMLYFDYHVLGNKYYPTEGQLTEHMVFDNAMKYNDNKVPYATQVSRHYERLYSLVGGQPILPAGQDYAGARMDGGRMEQTQQAGQTPPTGRMAQTTKTPAEAGPFIKPSANETKQFVLVKFDPRKLNYHLGEEAMSADEAAGAINASPYAGEMPFAIFTGVYYDISRGLQKPEGPIVIKETLVSDFNRQKMDKNYRTLWVDKAGHAHIEPTLAFIGRIDDSGYCPGVEFAISNKPQIAKDGKYIEVHDVTGDLKAKRTAIMIAADGSLMTVATKTEMTYRELYDALKAEKVPFKDILMLDGGKSTTMDVPGMGIYITTSRKMGNYLYVEN